MIATEMKQLLIYTGPNKKFSEEDFVLAKIQINNSLDLGWQPEDIIFATDFPFEYKGIKSIFLPQGLYYPFDLNANKVPVLIYLISNQLLTNNLLYWCHDFDAFENYKIKESELGLESFDAGFTHYTYKPEWQFGSLFLKTSALEILKKIDKTTRQNPYLSRNNEKTLTQLIKDGKIDEMRYKRMNSTYNFMAKFIQTIYNVADKPIKIVHFRPSNDLNIFMHGKNRLNMPLMSDRLINIFKTHGIQ